MIRLIVSAVCGVVGGIAEYILIVRVCADVVCGKLCVPLIIFMCAAPLFFLLPTAFLLTEYIAVTGCCMACALIIPAVVRTLQKRK